MNKSQQILYIGLAIFIEKLSRNAAKHFYTVSSQYSEYRGNCNTSKSLKA